MSWQAYVDTSLVGSGNVDYAAIYSAAGDSVWASSPGFTVPANELKIIVTSFGDANRSITSTGFLIGGKKYMTVTADEKVLVGKKGKEGMVCVKTKQAILVAHHPDTVLTPNARNTVEALGDYLISMGY